MIVKKKWRTANPDKVIYNYRKYYEGHSERNCERNKIWRAENPEKNAENVRKWKSANTEKVSEMYKRYRKKRLDSDPLYKFSMYIRTIIKRSIKNQGYTKKSKTFEILGCTFEEFKMHIESQFQEGMSWERRSEWHIDHHFPVSKARDEAHLLELNHYTNLRPLWAIDNIIKGAKIPEEFLK